MSKFAMVFPGQGSQSIGMLHELSETYPIVKNIFNQASDSLGYDLLEVINQGPIEKLNLTNITQPAILTASYALFKLWLEQNGTMPNYMAGHSLGEYSALVCAGVIDFKDAIKLVELRGKLMQEAVPAGVGAMYAIIGLDNESIAEACDQAAQAQIISPVNYNSPGQVVIAGHKEAAERASVICKEKGAKRVLPLSVSVPSHCALMKPAAEIFEKYCHEVNFKEPKIAVINNVDVQVEMNPEKIKTALVSQLYKPVRWTEIVTSMSDNGVSNLIEVGPGKVLTGLTKRIVSSMSCIAINDVDSLSTALNSVK